jgi:hypothetical protein
MFKIKAVKIFLFFLNKSKKLKIKRKIRIKYIKSSIFIGYWEIIIKIFLLNLLKYSQKY